MVTVEARAKINLTLDILGMRQDKFHAVETIMQTVDLYDTVELERTDGEITLAVDNPDVPEGKENLAWQAAAYMKKRHLTDKQGVSIKIAKRIPMGAGLGGGSADAAAVIRGINELYGLNLSGAKLCRRGAKIGSDVPFCVHGGTALGTGRGEILTELPPLGKLYVVIAKPDFSVSTAWAYGQFDKIKTDLRVDTRSVEACLFAHDAVGVAKLLGNVLEIPIVAEYPQIKKLKEIMLSCGALGALMSGSGSAVYALVKTKAQVKKIVTALKKENVEIFSTETYIANA